MRPRFMTTAAPFGGRMYNPAEPDSRLRDLAHDDPDALRSRFQIELDQLRESFAALSGPEWRKRLTDVRGTVESLLYFIPRARPPLKPLHGRINEMQRWYLLPVETNPTPENLTDLLNLHISLIGTTPDQERYEFTLIRQWLAPFVFAHDRDQCVRCGAARGLSIDHIVPISQRGANYGLNFQTLCRSCNAWKKTRVWWPGVQIGSVEVMSQ